MRILVTGTTGGIGGAVARAARAAGHEVVEWNRREFDAGAPLPGVPFGALVFATGECPVVPLAALSGDAFAEAVRVNCWLFVRLLREIVSRRLYDRDAGCRAVAVSSVSAVEGWPGGAAYCASKGALSAACRALDAELRPRGITVRAVEPRHVRTRMFDMGAGRMGVPREAARDPDDLAQEIMKGMFR